MHQPTRTKRMKGNNSKNVDIPVEEKNEVNQIKQAEYYGPKERYQQNPRMSQELEVSGS